MSGILPEFQAMDIKTADDVVIHLEMAGRGPAILFVHGYPETHLAWHKIAPKLTDHYTVILPDMRGYGDSSCPASNDSHIAYSNRSMANDLIMVMEHLGFKRFFICGHDRGARICMQMAIDYPDKVQKCMLLDIIPEYDLYNGTDVFLAKNYFHWFFLIQPDLPEIMIGANPSAFLDHFVPFKRLPHIFPEDVVNEYYRCFSRPEAIHASTEDYRASASTDYAMQETFLKEGGKIQVPLLVLYAKNGVIGQYHPEKVWQNWSEDLTIETIENCGHFMPEEAPDLILKYMLCFFGE